MHRIGFSTGALAHADFREALRMSAGKGFDAIELSALRAPEVGPLVEAVPDLDLSEYAYVSFHAPSNFQGYDEAALASLLFERLPEAWPVVLHPDASRDLQIWAPFGDRLLVENMDKRKPGARFVEELDEVFARLPDASFCFDIGHARQIDPTMLEAVRILQKFGGRLRQIHISEVNTASRHERISFVALTAFQETRRWIPRDAAVILETPALEDEMLRQAELALEALGLSVPEPA